MAGLVYKRASDAMEAKVGDDLVVLDARSGDTFALNEVAAVVWTSLSEPKDIETLRDALLADYDIPADQCTIELQQLLEELAEQGLVQKVG